MSIITISRGSFSKGREVAEKVAQRLDYATLSREVLLEASEDFNIPEIKLLHALHDAPSILERFTFGRERYLAYLEAAILEHFQRDNVVYHGLAGHFFVRHISHVLKVRIIADIGERIETETTRENISREMALERLKKDDRQRREWSRSLYGVDTWDPSLYDLVVHIHKLRVDDAVDIICHTAGFEQFETTPESQQALDDLALAARVKGAIIETYPTVRVSFHGGVAMVHVKASGMQEAQIIDDIHALTGKITGVREVKVHLVPTTLLE